MVHHQSSRSVGKGHLGNCVAPPLQLAILCTPPRQHRCISDVPPDSSVVGSNNGKDKQLLKVDVQVHEKGGFAISFGLIVPFTEPVVMRPEVIGYTITYDLKSF